MEEVTDFTRLSFKELLDLKAEVERQIEIKRKETRTRLLAEMKERAEAEGLSFDEVVGGKVNGQERRSAAKYRNPENPSQTWTGRGRRPAWVEAALKAGRALDSLEA